MAQTDFNFYNAYSSPSGGEHGLAFLNSALSNPLPSGAFGTYCRQYKIQPSGVPYGKALVWNAFVSSSNFVGIPNTKAQSLRAVVRTENGTQPSNTVVNVGVRTRTDSSNWVSGYCLTLGSITGHNFNQEIWFGSRNTYGLYLSLRRPNGNSHSSYPDVLIPGTFNPGTWYPIRMDVLPYGNLQDTINVYTGSMDGSGNITWSGILHTTTILAGEPVYNQANPGLVCGYTAIGENNDGYGDTSNPAKAFIDGLDIRVSDV